MSTKSDIRRFYVEKSDIEKSHLFDYDADGNLVEYKKVRGGRGDIVKTVILPKYTKATMEEIQQDEASYHASVEEATREFVDARTKLYAEYRNPARTTDSLFMLNQEVAEADKKLVASRFTHSYVSRENLGITTRQLYFENAGENKPVGIITMLETQAYPLQRMFRVREPAIVSLSEAKEKAKESVSKMSQAEKVLSAIGVKPKKARAPIVSNEPEAPKAPAVAEPSAVEAPVAEPSAVEAPAVEAPAVEQPAVKEPEKSIIQSISNTIESAVSAIAPKPKKSRAPIVDA